MVIGIHCREKKVIETVGLHEQANRAIDSAVIAHHIGKPLYQSPQSGYR